VAPAGHDRVKRQKVGTAAEELGFQVYLDLALGLSLSKPRRGDSIEIPESVRAFRGEISSQGA
jgi:hypothetical protein